ncbi:MAG: HAD family phosphatase, partial [Candidatus Omnitrophica bacterium]|nr:HAD family phosphatase [Candidatus Omnitrophota bacterium]
VRVNCFDVYEKEGEKWEKSLRFFMKRAGVGPTRRLLRDIFKVRQRVFKKYFRRYIFKDVEKILAALKKKGCLIGLVTGSSDTHVKKILPPAIRNMFDCIVAGNHVRRGKPSPEPYLKAARMLKVAPEECVVVENAPYGVESAKRAGMYCVAVSTSLPAAYLKRADLVVGELADIEKAWSSQRSRPYSRRLRH